MQKKKKKSISFPPREITSWKDVYRLPLHQAEYGSWVYDAMGNFVFQFDRNLDECKQRLVISVINGDKPLTNKYLTFYHKDGDVKTSDNTDILLIRGWGNLTGSGAMNLSAEVATKVQDTFADFIVQQLNKRN